MTKYNQRKNMPVKTASTFLGGDAVATGHTFNAAPGFARDAKSELFLLTVSSPFVGNKTYYEEGDARMARLRELTHAVSVVDPEWMARFVGWLRTTGYMRTNSLVTALEAAYAMNKAKVTGGRQIVNAALARPDEPGEAMAYWLQTYGRKLPKSVKRAVADGARRLYNQFSLLKYDTASHGVRFGDVVELTRPEATTPEQNDVFRHAIERTHGNDAIGAAHEGNVIIAEALPMVYANAVLRSKVHEGQTSLLLDTELLRAAGMTWEDVLSLAGSGSDKSGLWSAMIPLMNYMALLRNLANFDRAGLPERVAQEVVRRLTDPAEVAKSMQFPFRFLSAYRAVPSDRWRYPLGVALELSLNNIPELKGTSLILVDRSGSMNYPLNAQHSTQLGWSDASTLGLTRADAASIFGTALAMRNQGHTTLVAFGTDSTVVPLHKGDSLLRVVNERYRDMGGTNTEGALRRHYTNQDRVIIITDEQADYHTSGSVGGSLPKHVPMYTWNLAGYKYGHAPIVGNKYTFGGLTDHAFRLIPLLEAGQNQDWPF